MLLVILEFMMDRALEIMPAGMPTVILSHTKIPA